MRTLAVTLAVLLADASLGAQNAAFDVTSVKPNNSASGMVRMMPAANGGMQAVADRFKLVTHMDTREQQMYALVLARRDGKLGDKMTPSTADCSPNGPNGRGRGAAAPPAPGQRPQCGFMIGPGRLAVGGQTMPSFATTLTRFVGGVVVDKTGLTGTYDIELLYAPDPGISPTGRDLPPQQGGPPPAANSDAPSIFSAVQEQLGLKLESTKGPVDMLVIDGAEQPMPD
jgi:uncharacterized protein (TIGR03435 family)